MLLIELWDARSLGIIVCFPTGVTYTNQTCGTFCLHPKVEGCFIPLRDTNGPTHQPKPEDALTDHFFGPKYRGSGAWKGIDQEDADVIDGVLAQNEFTHVRVNRDRLNDSHEAWIYVTIEDDEEGLFSGFGPYPASGVLTWPNSD